MLRDPALKTLIYLVVAILLFFILIFGYDKDQQKGRMQELLFDDQSLVGIQYYFIGDISAVNTDNMWKAVKCG